MEIFYQKTNYGLKPCTDSDAEKERKLKIGSVYRCDIKQPRNYEFHKRYFALINCTWDCLTDEMKEHFKSPECLRKTLEIAAGHCDIIYNVTKQEYQDIPKSISFSSMADIEFRMLYDDIKRVIFSYVLKGRITEEQFFNHLSNF
nr:MAG TPA: Protein of unknown function (DUF1367) [Caudoviricetes sp.]